MNTAKTAMTANTVTTASVGMLLSSFDGSRAARGPMARIDVSQTGEKIGSRVRIFAERAGHGRAAQMRQIVAGLVTASGFILTLLASW